MNTKQIKTLYESPAAKVAEIKRRFILAASYPNSTDPYGRESWDE